MNDKVLGENARLLGVLIVLPVVNDPLRGVAEVSEEEVRTLVTGDAE